MPHAFNLILETNGYRLSEVRLVRYKDIQAKNGCSPYEFWHNGRSRLNLYQSADGIHC